MPLRSMTGFGQAEKETSLGLYHVEIRGVNNRFLELQIRQPRIFSNIENEIKRTVTESISRGSVSVFITCDCEKDSGRLTWDQESVDNYMKVFREIIERYKLSDSISLSNLLQFSDFIKPDAAKIDDKKLWSEFEPVLKTALDDFQKSRVSEAHIIQRDLKKRLSELKTTLAQIEERVPERIKTYAEELRKRIQQLLETPPDPQKLATEVALMADRLDISEECTRLNAHLEKFAECFETSEPVGKRMNFILQEMNREANTIGSKSNDAEISYLSVGLKENIEKIREQIQNIE